MRYLIISDIHANVEALDATLAAAGSYDHVLVLGDLVGYGPDPNAVIDRIRAFPLATCIRGNHDKVGAGLESVEGFNDLARRAIHWTAATLTMSNRQWLGGLPQGPVTIDPVVQICHGTPFNEDAYVFDDFDAIRALRSAGRPLCLFGHTHVPAIYRLDSELRQIGPPRVERFRLSMESDAQYLVNCGAVGQPRDGDPRSSFGILDSNARELTIQRARYDVATTQAKIIAAGLPEMLARRLEAGR